MKPGNDLGRAGLRLSEVCESLCESVSELLRWPTDSQAGRQFGSANEFSTSEVL